MKKKSSLAPAVALLVSVVSVQAWGAGFEKATLWSGRHNGKAGAAVADTIGAESIYFNPAGLAGSPGGNISLNLTGNTSKFDGKATYLNTQVEGATKLSTPFGATLGYGMTPQWGVGVGYFISGGSKAYQEELNYSGLNAGYDQMRVTLKNDLRISEFSVGTGYEVIPGLKLGAAWRLVHVGADFAFAGNTTLAAGGVSMLSNIFANDLSATRYNGWRAGAQYTPEDKGWGIGMNWRSEVAFIAKGATTGKREFSTAAVAGAGQSADQADLVGGPVEATATFPQQIQIGGYFKLMENLKLLAQYDWTQYAKNRQLGVDGRFTAPTSAASPTLTAALTNASLPNIQQSWHNQNVIRLGGEYMTVDAMALRAGYVLVSQVTAEDRAKSTSSIPGASHIATVGAGMSLMDNMLDVNGALEYAFGSSEGSNSLDSVTAGDYSSKGFGLHLGVGYRI